MTALSARYADDTIDRPALRPWWARARDQLREPAPRPAPLTLVETPPLPRLRPGEVWMVELAAEGGTLSPLEEYALGAANVVIYDRDLAPVVAAVLPLGGYAEPAATGDEAAGERCLRFAIDGWSVVRAIAAGTPADRDERFWRLRERLHAAAGAAPRVATFANADASAVGTPIEHALVAGEGRLTVVFGAVGIGNGPQLCAVSSNGLAG